MQHQNRNHEKAFFYNIDTAKDQANFAFVWVVSLHSVVLCWAAWGVQNCSALGGGRGLKTLVEPSSSALRPTFVAQKFHIGYVREIAHGLNGCNPALLPAPCVATYSSVRAVACVLKPVTLAACSAFRGQRGSL